MPDKKKISELQSVVLGNSDYFAVAHDNSGVRQSGKVSTTDIGQKVNGGIEYSGIHKEIIDHQNPIAALNDLQNYIIDSVLPSDSVTASLATIPDGADNVVLKSWKTTIIPVQASGTPSPSNPLPITGRTQIVATRTGKNLLGGSKLLANAQGHLPNGVTDTENKTFTFAASETPADGTSFTQGITFKTNTRYTLIFTIKKSTGTGANIRVRYTDGNYINLSVSTTDKEVIVYNTVANKTLQDIRKYSGSGNTTLYYDECGIFEGVVGADAFEAYDADSRTISLGATVLGGELDIKNGSAKSAYAKITFDGSETWVKSGNSFRTNDIADALNESGRNFVWCEQGEYLASGIAENGCWLTSKRIYFIPPSSVTDATAMQAWVANNNLTFVYPVATPTTLTTQAEEFRTFKGDNGFYTDCGDSTVEYRADIALYIAKNSGGGNRSLGLMMNPMSQPEETSEEETEQEDFDNGSNER